MSDDEVAAFFSEIIGSSLRAPASLDCTEALDGADAAHPPAPSHTTPPKKRAPARDSKPSTPIGLTPRALTFGVKRMKFQSHGSCGLLLRTSSFGEINKNLGLQRDARL